jgi:D-serine deaminase-like pyridoxal phosphate-dependent protein
MRPVDDVAASDPWDYDLLRAVLREVALPAMIVDLDVLEANVRRIAEFPARRGKFLRMATKSVRVPDLIDRILEVGGEVFRGAMCFSVPEAAFLARHRGLDDLLVAYPTVQDSDLTLLAELTEEGRNVTLMIDAPEHVARLAGFAQARGLDAGRPLQVAVDLDMSWRPRGIHVGAKRSPVRSLADFERVLDAVLAAPTLRLAGLMGYEAQIAGLGDANPFAPMLNGAKRWIRARSAADVARRRREVAELLERRGVAIDFLNGGGTGSLATTIEEPWLTEVTAGSGFLQSHLFDYFVANRNRPAFAYALQITRVPEPGMVTCQSGGFTASGETTADKAPVVFRPEGLSVTRSEAFGEVQTPLYVPAAVAARYRPGLGDPVFLRPAKAGEIAERFDRYLLKRGGEIVGEAPTYRGLGQAFY